MKSVEGGVTAAKGFTASGAEAGIKYKNRMDMALVYSKEKAKVAGVFTTNIVKAAPVLWDKEIVEKGKEVHAVLLNSGIANACTGKEGKEINEFMASEMADALAIKKEEVLTASTGVIGMQIPKDKVKIGIEKLVPALSHEREGGTMAAKAIMTTDTVKKEYAVTVEIEGKAVTIGGMCKGSGMIHPNMATMLGVITTDAKITKELLQKAIQQDVKESFNMISVDRDTSTNDTYLILANGLAENEEITEENQEYKYFCKALASVTQTLAKEMAKDGEGATKLLETTVCHAQTQEEARILAKSVITSNLVKTAIFGSDANWGRILCALGYSGAVFDPETVELWIQGRKETLQLYGNGRAAAYSEEKASAILSEKEIHILINMHRGDEKATAWGCDLTYDYVKINGDYRS
ncbi:MAG: bifunctional glutamate N-acetyltransferase/amino-acid acetyltransferase ArgJ [Acetivibrio sp.]